MNIAEKKVVIVDDEIPARNLLKEYLLDFPELNIIAECKNGIEALGVINALQPDIVFLDIQMPGKTGFEVLQEMEYIPQLIFTTAYDQYALKAFEVNAVDYLLKPYTKDRFATAISRLLSKGTEALKGIQQLSESFQSKIYPERILVEQGNKLVSILISDILWIEAEGDYTRLHTRQQTYLSNKGIGELEERLDPRQFQRIHRSAIIALGAIKEVHKEASGPQVVLQNGLTLKVSRSYIESIKRLIY